MLTAGDVTEDFVERPLWAYALASNPLPARILPRKVDVLIVGAGYTGMTAATETAFAGRDTLVLDAAVFGSGCSARNGGQVAPSIKPSVDALSRQFGTGRARAIHSEGIAALDQLRALVHDEALDCDWFDTGRLVGAHKPGVFGSLVKDAETFARTFDRRLIILPPGELGGEIGTDRYHGAVIHLDQASLHPAKLLRALADRALSAGAQIIDRCPVLRMEADGEGFLVQTARGEVRARDVILATNGYTGRLSPWHRRRIIPIRTSMIATEPLPPGLMDQLLPTRRNVVDTRRLMIYFRACPEGRRVIFGGRTNLFDTPAEVYVPRLLIWLRRLFPQLAPVRASHAWSGVVAYTFDALPHTGVRDGVHYAMGYCGSGISLSTHLGRKIGQRLLGNAEGRSALDDIIFATSPLYTGKPWFLAPSVALFRVLDAIGG